MKKLSICLLLGTLLISGCGKAAAKADTASSSAEAVSESEVLEAISLISESPEEETPTITPPVMVTPTPSPEPTPEPIDTTPEPISFDESWEFGANSMIHTGQAILYKAEHDRKDIVIGVNAGHGCAGGSEVRTFCHPDQTPNVSGGSTAEGSITATACATGMDFYDGTPEREITLAEAQTLKDLLLENGYDVLMIRDAEDVQLDNIARTLICNAYADCHIAIHWDGDDLDYDKGCYYMSVPDALKEMYPVSETWEKSNHLGDCLINGLVSKDCLIFDDGSMQMDLTQTSYSKVPSIDIELGNAASDHSQETLDQLAQGLLAGIDEFFKD